MDKKLDTDKKLLTTQETAQLLGISDARVRRMILDDKLTATKFGKLNMIKRTDAEKVKVYGKAGRPPKKPETVKDAPAVPAVPDVLRRLRENAPVVASNPAQVMKALKAKKAAE